MTTVPPAPRTLGTGLAELRSKWGWFVGLGALMLILGGVAFANLMLATAASVFLVGAMMLAAGIVQILHAFGVKAWGRFLFWLLSGIVYAAAGIVAFLNPALASAVFTLLLAAGLIAAGILRVWVGLQERPHKGWGWLVAAGAVTFLAGTVIALGWPFNSLWILGLILALDLVFQGWALIALGTALKVRA